jgi:hypothetical protein
MFVHGSRPDQKGVCCIGGSLVAMTAAFDHQPQIVFPGEIDSSDDIRTISGGYCVDARSRHPSIDPAGGLGPSGLIANVVGILQVLKNFLAS